MTIRFYLMFALFFRVCTTQAQNLSGSLSDRQSLEKATAAIREAFAKGDARLVAQLHHPDVVKYFGGTHVVTGRSEVEKGAETLFRNATIEFVENTVESTVFVNETAVQTCIFAIRSTPKSGTGKPAVSRVRAMVIYIRSRESPTGWLSLREMAQAAPDSN